MMRHRQHPQPQTAASHPIDDGNGSSTSADIVTRKGASATNSSSIPRWLVLSSTSIIAVTVFWSYHNIMFKTRQDVLFPENSTSSARIRPSLVTRKTTPPNEVKDDNHNNDGLLGLQPRSWDQWWSSGSSSSGSTREKKLCFDPGPKLKTQRTDGNVDELFPVTSVAFDQSSMFSRGLVFVKPMKVGGSSASGVNLRLSKNMASRLHMPYKMCENNFDHAMGYMFENRNKDNSFLWTMLRDPNKRAVSAFWHFYVSREGKEPNMKSFQKEIFAHDLWHDYLQNHVLYPPGDLNLRDSDTNLRKRTQDILSEYDFIAVTERFDESMVVMNMLLNDIDNNSTERTFGLGDMLYVKAKTKGGFDDGGKGGWCVKIQPSNMTAEMKEFLSSDQWRQLVRWDEALWRAADRSLDLAIDRLGTSQFEKKLKLYRQAQKSVNDRCRSHAVVPCEQVGWKRKPEETNCLFQDSGCAWACIDQFVEEWNHNVTYQANDKNADEIDDLLL